VRILFVSLRRHHLRIGVISVRRRIGGIKGGWHLVRPVGLLRRLGRIWLPGITRCWRGQLGVRSSLIIPVRITTRLPGLKGKSTLLARNPPSGVVRRQACRGGVLFMRRGGRGRGERIFPTDFIKVGLPGLVRQPLSRVDQALHQLRKLRPSPQKAFVIIRFAVRPWIQKALESPTVHRSIEAFELCMCKMLRANYC